MGVQYHIGAKFIPVRTNMKGTVNTSTSFSLASKVKDYFQLIKFTLSFTVVFSCVICYLLAPNVVEDLPVVCSWYAHHRQCQCH